MPHAVGMPSFLADDPELLFASSRPSFDLPSYRRHSCEKANGNFRSPPYTSGKNNIVDETAKRIDEISDEDNLEVRGLNTDTNGRSAPNSSNGKYLGKSTFPDVTTPTTELENGCGTTHRDYFQILVAGKNFTTSPNGQIPTKDTDNISLLSGENKILQSPTLSPPIPPHADRESSPRHLLKLWSAESQTTPSNYYRFSFPTSTPKRTPPITSQSTSLLQNHDTSQMIFHHTLQIPKPGPVPTAGADVANTTGRISPITQSPGIRRSSFNLTVRSTQAMGSNISHDEVPPDDNAMIWAEAVRQKRASKRRKKDDEDDDRVIVGTKVDQNHVNWVTAYNMLTGIRFTVSRTNAKIDRPLTDADFEARHKFSFDITGNELTPSAKYDFKFKDYAPWVFRHLRAKFKLDPADYLMSLTSKYILSELGSPGKSGSFFYFSRDYKYIIKTIHHSEHKFLRKILKEYFAHVEQNPNTLLSQFYGLHRVKMPYGRKIHFVVMNNLFPPHRDIHQTFDLKGSTIGRDYKEEDLSKNPRATLKDLNWLRRNLHLEFGPEKRNLFFEQIEKDVHLLQRLGIMDYSMLVGIHNLQIGNQENLRDKTLQVFQPGGDNPSEETERGSDARGSLMRTPSKMETARKARELRQIIKQEKPIPMGQSSSRMPDTLEQNPAKKELLFYGDDGGFQATHEDDSPGEQIFFLSIIDCLTHYGTVKKLEHFWKGLKYDKRLISPVSPDPYGERFVEFIERITKCPEEAKRKALSAPLPPLPTSTNNNDKIENYASLNPETTTGSENPPSNLANPKLCTTKKKEFGENHFCEENSNSTQPRPSFCNERNSSECNGNINHQVMPVVAEIGETKTLAEPIFRNDKSQHSASIVGNTSSALRETKHSDVRISMSSIGSCDKELPPLPKRGE